MAFSLDSKGRAYLILGIVAVVSFIFYKYSDTFAVWTSVANPVLAMVASIILNPAYIFLIYLLWTQYNIRGLISGLLIAISIDIISMNHSIMIGGKLPVDKALYGYSDTSIYQLLGWLPANVAVFVLYVIVPVLLVYIAFRVIRKTSAFNKIFREAI